jgi:hypothetical protein
MKISEIKKAIYHFWAVYYKIWRFGERWAFQRKKIIYWFRRNKVHNLIHERQRNFIKMHDEIRVYFTRFHHKWLKVIYLQTRLGDLKNDNTNFMNTDVSGSSE